MTGVGLKSTLLVFATHIKLRRSRDGARRSHVFCIFLSSVEILHEDEGDAFTSASITPRTQARHPVWKAAAISDG